MSNDDTVRLDLNVPAFQKKLFALDAGEVKKAFKTFQKLQALTWHEPRFEVGASQKRTGHLHDSTIKIVSCRCRTRGRVYAVSNAPP